MGLWGPDPIDARRFVTLLGQLPEQSRTVRAQSDGAWPTATELVAVGIEQIVARLDVVVMTTATAVSSRRVSAPKPFVIPRPWLDAKRRRQSSAADLARFVRRHTSRR